MAGYPQWTSDFPPPFLQQAQALGFNGKLGVDARDPLGFFQLVGYMIALHNSKCYPQIMKPLERWSKKVAGIVDAFNALDTNNPEWWRTAGEKTRRTILDSFIAQNKGEQVVAFEHDRPVTHNANQFLSKFAEEFLLCLVWMEYQRDDPIEHEFMPKSRDEIALCVYLAEENGTLFLLFHQDIGQVPVAPQASHYILTCNELKHLSIQTGRMQRSAAEERLKQAEKMQWKAEGDMLNALSHLVLDCHLTDTASAQLSEFKKSLGVYKEMLKVTNARGTTQLDLLEKVEKTQLKVQKMLPKQHSINKCAESSGALIKVCTHQFHADCIRIYVESLFAANMNLVCPVDKQPLSPSDIRAASVKVHDAIQTQKYITTAHLTGNSTHRGSPQASFFLPMQTMPMGICGICSRQDVYSGSHSAHLCRLCLQESARAYRPCPVCMRAFTNEDLMGVGPAYRMS